MAQDLYLWGRIMTDNIVPPGYPKDMPNVKFDPCGKAMDDEFRRALNGWAEQVLIDNLDSIVSLKDINDHP